MKPDRETALFVVLSALCLCLAVYATERYVETDRGVFMILAGFLLVTAAAGVGGAARGMKR